MVRCLHLFIRNRCSNRSPFELANFRCLVTVSERFELVMCATALRGHDSFVLYRDEWDVIRVLKGGAFAATLRQHARLPVMRMVLAQLGAVRKHAGRLLDCLLAMAGRRRVLQRLKGLA